MHLFKNTTLIQKGFNMVELTMVIVIIGILASFAMISYGSLGEARDAAMIQSAQASLQAIISQGSARMDVRPDALAPAAVITAVNTVLGSPAGNNGEATFQAATVPYRLNFRSSPSWATFAIDGNGDVALTQISGNLAVKGYVIQNGVLVHP